MPLAVTHVLLVIITLDLYRDYFIKNRKLIPLKFIFYGGVAGLLPDIDIPINWIVNLLGFYSGSFHRLFTHSIFFIIFLMIILSTLFLIHKNKRLFILYSILIFGVLSHVILDFIFTDHLMLFYPVSTLSFGINIFGRLGLYGAEAGLDALIFLFWLWHEEKKHKISDFI